MLTNCCRAHGQHERLNVLTLVAGQEQLVEASRLIPTTGPRICRDKPNRRPVMARTGPQRFENGDRLFMLRVPVIREPKNPLREKRLRVLLHCVARLEHGFGTPLLRRTTRKMTVTDAGQTYFDRARTILEDLRAVEQEMASKNAEPRGLVRVSASLLLGQTRVVPILPKTPRTASGTPGRRSSTIGASASTAVSVPTSASCSA